MFGRREQKTVFSLTILASQKETQFHTDIADSEQKTVCVTKSEHIKI